MRRARVIAGVCVSLAGGCSAGASPRVAASATRVPDAARAPVPTKRLGEPPTSERRALDGARTGELASPELDDRFAVVRQVDALERAIVLYQAFLERAGDDPRYAEAVRRSQGRIEDARLTICFLLEKPCDGGADGEKR